MQTFLPENTFSLSAACLDNKRLGKQRVEAKQILMTLEIGPEMGKCSECNSKLQLAIKPELRTFSVYNCYHCGKYTMRVVKTPWYNHPAVQMWKGYENALIIYGSFVCQEWIDRGFKDTLIPYFRSKSIDLSLQYPPWYNQALISSHRSNLLRKDFAYYSKFNWTEPSNLPYIWPTKK